MIRIHALKDQIESGGQSYPIFLALMQADVIAAIADVPSYRESTTNADVALNVSIDPVKEWQRREIPSKIESIRQLFNNTGELMPNPILIGQNPNATIPPLAEPYLVAGNATPLWELAIDESASRLEKPLWILDGQHRVAGLAKSAQSSNPVPVVFLLNQGAPYYSADRLAQIFAQVTTSATPLGPLHREWLSYAFKLNHYSSMKVHANEQLHSMAAIVSLCKTPRFDVQPNPFHDRIQFIDGFASPSILPGGHVYNCIEFKDIVSRCYYSAQKSQPELSPDELAKQMCFARNALASVIKTPADRSVFFGDEDHHQKIMEDAFWAGVLRFLAVHGAPRSSWTDVLRTLKFNETNWDFSWKVTLHGKVQNTSKKLAIKVMEDIFSKNELPSGNNNIDELLRGNGAHFELEAFLLTSSGKRSAQESMVLKVTSGDNRSFPIEPCVGIRLINRSLNIGEVEVTDMQAPPGKLVPYKEVLRKQGMTLDQKRHNNPLQLLFTLKHYGGEESSAKVQIDWKP